MKVVVLNGPPNTGKDTIANSVSMTLQSYGMKCGHIKVSAPLKQLMQSFALYMGEDLVSSDAAEAVTDDAIKDTVQEVLLYLTPRVFQIALSERFFKPLFGNDILGKIALRRLAALQLKDYDIVFFDCGFAEELMPIIDVSNRNDLILVRLHREGVTFEGDSRRYIPDVSMFDTYDLHIPEISRGVVMMLDILKARGWFTDANKG